MYSKTKKKRIIFKRWSRKNYSIYNSLHKVVCIGVLGLNCSMLNAQDKQDSVQQVLTHDSIAFEKELEEVEITANEAFAPLLQPAKPVVDQVEVEQAAVQNIQDILHTAQGIDLRTRGTEGVQADISYRGGTFDQTTILLNGINVTDPQTGHYSLNLPISTNSLEKIDLIKERNTISGTVNFIAKYPKTNTLEVDFSDGQYGYFQGGILATYVNEKIYALADIRYTQSDGYAENTDFQIGNAYGLVGSNIKHFGNLELQMGTIHKQYGANGFYSQRYKEQHDATITNIAGLAYSSDLGFWRRKLSASVYFRENHDKFELFRYEAPAWYAGPNYHLTRVFGGDALFKYQAGKFKTFVGVDVRNENILSSNLGDSLDNPQKDPKDDSGLFLFGKDRIYGNVFVGQEYYLGNYKWSVAWELKGSVNNDYGFKLFSNAKVKYLPTQNLMLSTFISHAYRMPTFTDLYYQSASQVGDKNLKPEEAVSGDITVEWELLPKRLHIKPALFFRYGFNTIDWVRKENQDVWYAMNFTDISTLGFDIDMNYSFKNSFLKSAKLGYTYLFSTKNTHGYLSLYATDYLRNQLKFGLIHTIYKNISASWLLSFNDRNGTYFDYDRNAETSYKPYVLCDLKIMYNYKNWDFFVEATNLFNVKYSDIGNLPQAGIWAKAGVKMGIAY